jgi:hypothetical protein
MKLKHNLSIVSLLFVCFSSFSKGSGGYYDLNITLKDRVTGNLLLNEMLIVDTDTFHSDKFGQIKAKINWKTVCPSGISKPQKRKHNRTINSEWIVLQSQNKEIKLRNKWKKYGLRNENERKIFYKTIYI